MAFGKRTACRPFGVAAGRDALGPELARRVRGEMDHGAMRVDVARAAALARLTRSKPSVNFSTLDMLACAAFSRHATHSLTNHSKRSGRGGRSGSNPETSRYPWAVRDPFGTYSDTVEFMAEAMNVSRYMV
jgi:hypothetical protein